MGNAQSSSQAVSDIVNKSVTNVLMSSSSQCGQNNSASQTLDFSNITASDGCNLDFNNITQTMIQTPNFTCSSNSQNESDLMSQFKSQLDQNSQAALSGLSGALNSNAASSTISKLKNEIENNINISQVSSCVQNSIADQKLKFNKINANCPAYCRNPQFCKGVESLCDMSKCTTSFSNIGQSMTQAAVGSCLASNANLNKVISDASTQLTQASTSKNTGIDFTAIFASLGSWLLPLIICIVVCCSSLLVSSVMGMSGGGGIDMSKLDVNKLGKNIQTLKSAWKN